LNDAAPETAVVVWEFARLGAAKNATPIIAMTAKTTIEVRSRMVFIA
jgi:hypothetical protein